MKRIVVKAISVLLAAAIIICSAPLTGFLNLELPEIGKLFSDKAEASETYTSGYFTCSVDENGNATVTRCDTSVSGDIVIPPTIDGYPVTAIGTNAFLNCSSIVSLTLPYGLASLGNAADPKV